MHRAHETLKTWNSGIVSGVSDGSPEILVVASQVVLARGPRTEDTQSMKGIDSSTEKVNSKEETLSDVTMGPFNKPERRAQSLKEADPKPEGTSPSEESSNSTNSIPLECLKVTYKWLPWAD